MILAIILRFVLDEEQFGAVRILYSLTLLLCILRLLKLFYIHQYVGPKVIMIQKVVREFWGSVQIMIDDDDDDDDDDNDNNNNLAHYIL